MNRLRRPTRVCHSFTKGANTKMIMPQALMKTKPHLQNPIMSDVGHYSAQDFTYGWFSKSEV